MKYGLSSRRNAVSETGSMQVRWLFGSILMLLSGVLSCSHPQRSIVPVTRTSADQHAALVRRYFKEVWSEGRLDVLDELLAPHYINHTPSTPDPPPGPAGLKPIVAAFRQAFPDLRFTVEDLVASGDRVAVRVRMEGTHTGPLFGISPTQRRVNVQQINIERFVGTRIVEHWRVTDELSLMRQLGLVSDQH